jgi:hypothetical protein
MTNSPTPSKKPSPVSSQPTTDSQFNHLTIQRLNSNDQLNLQQQDVCNLLLGDPALAAVPVSTFKAMLISAVAAEATDMWTDRSGRGKKGCAIQVRMPALRVQTPNVPGPQYQVEYTIRVFEDPVENNTGLTAESIALEILAWLDGAMITGNATILADTRGPALRPVYEYSDRFAYDVILVAQSPQDSRDRTVAATLTDDGHGNITLVCADPNAQIYYSINAALPVIAFPNNVVGSNQQVGTPYSAPFAVNAGDTGRFFAYTPGLLPSFISCAVITD